MASRLPCENKILRQFVQCILSDDAQESCQQVVWEYGSCQYCLQYTRQPESEAGLQIHLAYSRRDGDMKQSCQVDPSSLEQLFQGFLSVTKPRPGYAYAFTVDTSKLKGLDRIQQEAGIRKIAALRHMVATLPLRRCLTDFVAGRTVSSGAVACTVDASAPILCCASDDCMTVVVPLRFSQACKEDTAIQAAFLQETASAATQPSKSGAPHCSCTDALPPQLASLMPQDATYAKFFQCVLRREHIASTDKLENVLWSLASLQVFLHLHSKCFKAHMHSQMRTRLNRLLDVLSAPKLMEADKTISATW